MSLLKAGRPSATKDKAIELITQNGADETVRMNVNIPKVLHRQLKQCALNEDSTITEIVLKLLHEYVSK